MKLEVIVNGIPVVISAAENRSLGVACNQAFAAAGLVGIPLENWEVRNEEGTLLDTAQFLHYFNLADKRIFLSPYPGGGG